MRAVFVVLGVLLGCGRSSSPSPPPAEPPPAEPPLARVLDAVGPHPRALAVLSPRDPALRDAVARLDAQIRRALGTSPAECGIALDGLDELRIAIGEPLRIAVELDGKIDVHAVTCLLGGDHLAMLGLTRYGVIVRNREGGIAIEYRADPTQAARGHAVGAELLRRCPQAGCAAAMLGPAGRPLWIQLDLRDRVHLELSGPSMARGAADVAAAFDQLRGETPGLDALTVRARDGAIVAELPKDPPAVSALTRALALRADLLASFVLPAALRDGVPDWDRLGVPIE